jgi:hypothetical protein
LGHNRKVRSDDREAEGAPLLREYAGKNLHRGFESLSLRQEHETRRKAGFAFQTRRQAGFVFWYDQRRRPTPYGDCSTGRRLASVPDSESVVPQHRAQLTHIKYAAETLVGYLHFLIWRLR